MGYLRKRVAKSGFLRSFALASAMAVTFSESWAQSGLSSADAIKTAIAAAAAGTTVQVADGKYDLGYITIASAGTEAAPIRIKAANRGKVELTGNSSFTFKPGAAYVQLEGFVFTGSNTAVKMEGAHHIRLTRNVFRMTEKSSLKWILVGGANSRHNRIDHNLFEQKKLTGSFITIDGDSYSDAPTLKSSQHDRIDHNHFRDNGPRAVNEQESIRVGWSAISRSSGFTVVEHNLFERCDGDPEIVSVKTCDNIVRYNTFRASQGTLSLRHGDRTLVEGNVFLGDGKAGTGGIRICGADHKVVNNHMQGLTGAGWDAPLAITNGDASGTSGALNSHFIATGITIAFNTLVDNDFGVEFGHGGPKYSKPAGEITLTANLFSGDRGVLGAIHTAPSKVNWAGNLFHVSGTAKLGLPALPAGSLEGNPKWSRASGLWRPGPGGAAMDAAGTVTAAPALDMDGQTRTGIKDVGADEQVQGNTFGAPLTAAEVGPDSPEAAEGRPVAIRSNGRWSRSTSVTAAPGGDIDLLGRTRRVSGVTLPPVASPLGR